MYPLIWCNLPIHGLINSCKCNLIVIKMCFLLKFWKRNCCPKIHFGFINESKILFPHSFTTASKQHNLKTNSECTIILHQQKSKVIIETVHSLISTGNSDTLIIIPYTSQKIGLKETSYIEIWSIMFDSTHASKINLFYLLIYITFS